MASKKQRPLNDTRRALTSVLYSKACDKFELDEVVHTDEWTLRMPATSFVPDGQAIFEGLERHAARWNTKPEVVMHLRFPQDYPRAPPFVRVVSPRFAFHTGHVTVGGSLCTPILAMEGWDPSMTGEALVLALHNLLIDGDGAIDLSVSYGYSEAEAKEAFQRVARDHNWTVAK